jgi:hypothetical protein
MMTDQQRNEKRQRHPTAQDEDAKSESPSYVGGIRFLLAKEREGTWRLSQWIRLESQCSAFMQFDARAAV